MELNYSNLTDPNQNNLKYRKQFENFQKEKCKSKTMLNMENRIHYNRILDALTDNRSIDILNKSSLENVNKLNEKEFIIKYVDENKSDKSPDNMVLALAIALEIPLGETRRVQSLYDIVIERLRRSIQSISNININRNNTFNMYSLLYYAVLNENIEMIKRGLEIGLTITGSLLIPALKTGNTEINQLIIAN